MFIETVAVNWSGWSTVAIALATGLCGLVGWAVRKSTTSATQATEATTTIRHIDEQVNLLVQGVNDFKRVSREGDAKLHDRVNSLTDSVAKVQADVAFLRGAMFKEG